MLKNSQAVSLGDRCWASLGLGLAQSDHLLSRLPWGQEARGWPAVLHLGDLCLMGKWSSLWGQFVIWLNKLELEVAGHFLVGQGRVGPCSRRLRTWTRTGVTSKPFCFQHHMKTRSFKEKGLPLKCVAFFSPFITC